MERDAQYGGSFDGNACKKLLCHIDLLDSLVPLHCKAFVTAFKCLNDTISACFSTDLKYNFNEEIDKFRISFLDLGISVTPKIHAIFYHVSEFCSSACTGLGKFSEQASEAVHHKFSVEWERFKVLDIHPDFPGRLLRAVNVFNTNNL